MSGYDSESAEDTENSEEPYPPEPTPRTRPMQKTHPALLPPSAPSVWRAVDHDFLFPLGNGSTCRTVVASTKRLIAAVLLYPTMLMAKLLCCPDKFPAADDFTEV